ncbi:unnamed protein product [Clavelina lepadiformis]|uniref:Caspase-3 n=1 Tax=Clavelina lepadiformis TaxID=159417 RepID=A0ABP0G7E6_CLALP
MKPAGDVSLQEHDQFTMKAADTLNSLAADFINSRSSLPDEASSSNDVTDGNPFEEPTFGEGVELGDGCGDFFYNMNHAHRGCFIIFNQKIFEKSLGLGRRVGSNVDYFALESLAKYLGFEFVKTFHDLTKQQIQLVLERISTSNHASYDCFALSILTHGEEGDVLFARDGKMNLSEFIDPFTTGNCPTLAGKPKFFFIQACRGRDLDRGARVQSDNGDAPGDQEENVTVLPSHCDVVVAHATPPGYAAWRNETHGSWFVQSLYNVVLKHGRSLELMQIMTRVNNMVATKFRSMVDGSKQIPSIVTRLRGEVYFKTKVSRELESNQQAQQCSRDVSRPAYEAGILHKVEADD